ncbi:MAG: hypothetical protein GXO16_01815 [Epsilonproteobacteria bacterium]|nr:hypothetical protein [Campylobacterota bacterium]
MGKEPLEIEEYDWQTYCPRRRGFYSHKHAAYTAKILSDYVVEKRREERRIVGAEALGGKFIDIAAKHHKPGSDDEWIVAAADRLASGFERECFEEYNEQVEEEVKKSYKEQRLDHLFVEGGKFPLDVLEPSNIFASDDPGRGYGELWKGFKEEIREIEQTLPEHINKADALEYLLKKYCSLMPSATSFKSANKTASPKPIYPFMNICILPPCLPRLLRRWMRRGSK